jgi:hypothetical protein
MNRILLNIFLFFYRPNISLLHFDLDDEVEDGEHEYKNNVLTNNSLNNNANKDTENNGNTSYSNTYSSDYPKWKQWHDLSMNCYKKELCKNKENATSINNLQNNHLGSDQNYENTKALYMNEYVKTINLSIWKRNYNIIKTINLKIVMMDFH